MKKINFSFIKVFAMMLMFTFITQSATAQSSAKIDSKLAEFTQLRNQYLVNSAKYNYVNQMVTYYSSAKSLSASSGLNAEQAAQQAGTRPQFFPFALQDFTAKDIIELNAYVNSVETKGGAALQSKAYLERKAALLFN